MQVYNDGRVEQEEKKLCTCEILPRAHRPDQSQFFCLSLICKIAARPVVWCVSSVNISSFHFSSFLVACRKPTYLEGSRHSLCIYRSQLSQHLRPPPPPTSHQHHHLGPPPPPTSHQHHHLRPTPPPTSHPPLANLTLKPVNPKP